MGIARKVEFWKIRGLEKKRDVRRLINSWGFVGLCHDLYNLFAGKILLFDGCSFSMDFLGSSAKHIGTLKLMNRWIL